jgi:hypothetical protein
MLGLIQEFIPLAMSAVLAGVVIWSYINRNKD